MYFNSTKSFDDRFKNTRPYAPIETGQCKRCYDSGYAKVNNGTNDLWAFCSCKKGNDCKIMSKYKLARIDNEMLSSGFSLVDFPLSAFLPVHSSGLKELWSKVGKFKKSLIESEKLWE